MSSPTPVAEVKRAKQGDEQAFATLYQLRAGEVYRYERSLLRDHTAAEDVTAQTFLQAWESLSKLRRLDRFDAWLFRIAHNVAMTELRRTRTTALDDAPEPADPSRFHNPETLLQGSIDAQRYGRRWHACRTPCGRFWFCASMWAFPTRKWQHTLAARSRMCA